MRYFCLNNYKLEFKRTVFRDIKRILRDMLAHEISPFFILGNMILKKQKRNTGKVMMKFICPDWPGEDYQVGHIKKGQIYLYGSVPRYFFDKLRKKFESEYVRSKESIFQKHFVKSLNEKYQEKVRCKYGEIDVLTDKIIYELKYDPKLHAIQQALGQLLFYHHAYSERKMVLVSNRKIKDNLIAILKYYNIEVQYA